MADRPIIGVGVMVWRDHQLLMGKRILPDDSFCWQLPGGRLEPEETVKECAAREVLEETGIRIRNLRDASYTDSPADVSGDSCITLYVSADHANGSPEVKEPEKCLCWEWFDPVALPSPLFEPVVNFLSQYPDLSVFDSDRCS